jgi:hypothetical protein
VTSRHAELGQRVAGVLDAAEQAAEEICADARAEAERIVREAEERGRARVEELTGVPERLRAEADEYAAQTRTVAEADAEHERVAALEDARATRARAEEEARALEAQATANVRAIEEGGRARKAEITREIEALVRERREAVERLRDTLKSLARVLAEAAPDEAQGRLSKLFGRGSEETMYEALKEGVTESARGNGATGKQDPLYAEAKRLGIRGRSTMSRSELVEAVRARGGVVEGAGGEGEEQSGG